MLSQRLAAYEVHSAVPEPKSFTTEAPDTNDIQPDVKGFLFEELLMNSRVYGRAANNGDDGFSILSSAGRTASWSMLTGLSLSEMSNIAILALPVYAEDIRNADSYDFGVATIDPSTAVELPEQSPQSRKVTDWWKRFRSEGRIKAKSQTEPHSEVSNEAPIFGIALSVSTRYGNIAISVSNDRGETFICGYIPILVAKCGVFLKEKG